MSYVCIPLGRNTLSSCPILLPLVSGCTCTPGHDLCSPFLSRPDHRGSLFGSLRCSEVILTPVLVQQNLYSSGKPGSQDINKSALWDLLDPFPSSFIPFNLLPQLPFFLSLCSVLPAYIHASDGTLIYSSAHQIFSEFLVYTGCCARLN